MARSFKPEFIADGTGQWSGNGLRFFTRDEAEGYGQDLKGRWFLVTETRAVESDEEPNYHWGPARGLVPIGGNDADRA